MLTYVKYAALLLSEAPAKKTASEDFAMGILNTTHSGNLRVRLDELTNVLWLGI
ncbi:MAG: hypothetical protein LBF72_01475 [Holosporales bacterium]|jgi:hypothetical protein|nr:hypothetical protein [Holosporales bacterium]